jgi:16S rRNA (guanine(966)-N(2))-methyltransferase RsmD
VRVTGGSLRGRTVGAARGHEGIRPAMDRMRESVFAVLGDLSGVSFLDLFSGSGIIALEAVSRGADPVTCVEKDPDKRRSIAANLAIAPRPVRLRIMPVELYLMRSKDSFDLVFADPPFPYRFRADLCLSLSRRPVLKPGGLLLIHYPSDDPLPEALEGFIRVDRRAFGRSVVDFLRKEGRSP